MDVARRRGAVPTDLLQATAVANADPSAPELNGPTALEISEDPVDGGAGCCRHLGEVLLRDRNPPVAIRTESEILESEELALDPTGRGREEEVDELVVETSVALDKNSE